MRKFLTALLLCVLTLTVVAVVNAPVEVLAEESEDPWVDQYPWIKAYEEDGKWVYFIQGSRTDNYNRGYSGVDVIFGDWVVLIPRGNVLTRKADDSPTAATYSSLVQLFYNNGTDDWNLTLTLGNIGGADGVIIADANGKVVRIANSQYIFDFVEEGDETPYYDIAWDDEAEEQIRVGSKQHQRKPLEYIHLTYGMLGTEYPWLTKEEVDNNAVEGVTFQDDDLLYYNAETKKYSNNEEDGDPVMNEQLGYTIPAGGWLLAFKYLDRGVADLNEQWKQFYTIVNGEDGVFEVEYNDVNPPVFSGVPTGTVYHDKGKAYELPEVTAVDVQPFTDNVDLTDRIQVKIYQFNRETQAYDIEIEKVEDMDLDYPTNRFKIEYRVKDDNDNEAVASFVLEVIGDRAPVFVAGLDDKRIDQGQAIDLLEGLVVDDGYGNPIDPENLVVITDLDVNKPGVYTVTYVARNAFNLTTIATRKITVADTEAPKVMAMPNITIVKGEAFDYKQYIFAVDNATPANKLVMYIDNEGDFDLNEVGIQEIVVAVADEAGNETKVTLKVKVLESSYDDQLDDQKADLDTLQGEYDKLQKAHDDLKSDLQSKVNVVLTLSVIALVIGVAGVGLAVPSLLKKKSA